MSLTIQPLNVAKRHTMKTLKEKSRGKMKPSVAQKTHARTKGISLTSKMLSIWAAAC